jgi:spermidine/putrescine ABC transporter ATP-binding subunit
MRATDFVSIENLSRRFGNAPAVDHVNLSIARGEFFSLLGPSGCGKTTLLRMIGGFTSPDEGAIRIDGEDMTSRPPERRPVNMVFQSYAIFPHLNVAENIAYGLRRDGLSKAERDRRVEEVLRLISLTGYGARRAHELSGGERQRVALARALVKRPKLLLLDEPLGALDKRLRESMQLELRRIQRETGVTFLFVTHDQEEALAMSDRIAVMEHGRVLQVADPRTLYDAPNSRAVAGFIGTMNFFDGRVVGTGGGDLVLDVAGFGRLCLPQRHDCSFAPGAAVTLAVRPEKLLVSQSPPSDGASLRGRILSSVYLGDRTQIKLVTAEANQTLSATIAANAAFRPTREEIYISLLPADALLLAI